MTAINIMCLRPPIFNAYTKSIRELFTSTELKLTGLVEHVIQCIKTATKYMVDGYGLECCVYDQNNRGLKEMALQSGLLRVPGYP